MRRNLSTPCPVTEANASNARRISTISNDSLNSDTTELEYTRYVQQEFNNARPRRPRKADRKAGFTIFENVTEAQELVLEHKDEQASRERKTLLSRPLRGRLGSRDVSNRSSSTEQKMVDLQTRSTRDEQGSLNSTRRRTIYVPSDDTTIMTLHPGSRLAARLNDTFYLQEVTIPHQDMGAVHAGVHAKPTRAPRMSLSTMPKRVPLQHLADACSNTLTIDRFGDQTGKENVPPGQEKETSEDLNEHTFGYSRKTLASGPHAKRVSTITQVSNAGGCNQLPKSVLLTVKRDERRSILGSNRQTSTLSQTKQHAPTSFDALFSPLREPMPLSSVKQAPAHSIRAPVESLSAHISNIHVSSSTVRKRILIQPRAVPARNTTAASTKVTRYQVLKHDITNTAMYEDHWLHAEEAALSQVINQILAKAEPSQSEPATEDKILRTRLLEIYQESSSIILYERLQSLIQHGTLKLSELGIAQSDLTKDLALRRRYISSWLNTFNPRLLKLAAEIVVGRCLTEGVDSQPPAALVAAETILDPTKNRRELTAFLDTFFVTVDDLVIPATMSAAEHQVLRHNKSVLRSLMLLWLLNQIKQRSISTSLLFKKTASNKTTSSTLQSLARILLPSHGDISRALRHIGHELSHVQQPIDEVRYKVNSLATDIRDGILLARLLDVLRQARSSSKRMAWVELSISTQLLLPCHARVQKIANVNLVLETLQSDQDLAPCVCSVTAEDIVDGHREKTIALLWSLISDHGLALLVNLDHLAVDTVSARSKVTTTDRDTSPDGSSRIEEQLLQWAAARCALNGFAVTNLTTSFADGQAYFYLVKSFADQLCAQALTGEAVLNIQQELRSLGCRSSIIDHFANMRETIPSRNTTLANLTCLASVLLPLKQIQEGELLERDTPN